MVTETHSYITGKNARIYLRSNTTKSPITIKQVIEFLQNVSKQYLVKSVEDIHINREVCNEEYTISCQILIMARKEDWEERRVLSSKINSWFTNYKEDTKDEAQEEKDRRLVKYLELKKEFEK